LCAKSQGTSGIFQIVLATLAIDVGSFVEENTYLAEACLNSLGFLSYWY